MEGLRGFAVFLVFLVHYATLFKPWMFEKTAIYAFATGLQIAGSGGVDLFFVMSGYLIYGSLIERKQRFGRFMWRRLERIYPTFVVVFAIYVFLSFVFRSENKIPSKMSEGLIY